MTHGTENEQSARWNGRAGNVWVEEQTLLDRLLGPMEEPVLAAVPAGHGGRVLDVGCGTGGTTVAVARRLGTEGRCLGVDISEPMIAAARERAEREGVPASFLRADAQAHAFEPGTFDTIVSRFGVMFFDDPVRAFANLRRAAEDGARLRCVVWRGAEDNPFMTTAERAAAPLLPDLPARSPDGPGQFAFADPDRVRDVLTRSGWAEADIVPFDAPCSLPTADLVRYFTRLGPLGQFMPDVPEEVRPRLVETVRAAFEPFVHGPEVRFVAAGWTVDARAR
ncbi:class I SAM-dependent methyltransferase [Streptomyces sp. NPDC058867]|uniref:class I SAM-dependent methyltransferase n=1 Tax=unclassified Streptomyces TaxID=2593676 RepID=UPI00369CEE76